MTPAQLAAGQSLIPCAYEPRAPRHPATPAVPFVPVEHPRSPAPSATRQVPRSLAMLGDLALAVAVIFAVALAPVIAVNVIALAVRLVQRTFN